jgi:hypothetical protein
VGQSLLADQRGGVVRDDAIDQALAGITDNGRDDFADRGIATLRGTGQNDSPGRSMKGVAADWLGAVMTGFFSMVVVVIFG